MRPFGLQTAAGLQTTARRARPQASRRRGAVLIMVVAVLGILFVSGAALLTVVTFSSRSVDAAKAERESRDAVDAIERLVAMKLRDGFLNADGVPYALTTPLVMHQPGQPNMPCGPATACVLALPTNGEQPGVHPWIDLSEPVEAASPSSESAFRLVSNLAAALDNRSVHTPAVAANNNVRPDAMTYAVPVNRPAAVPTAFGFSQGAMPYARTDTDMPQWQFLNDADGDGVFDGIEIVLPPGTLPANVHRALADRLRPTIYPSGEPDRLTVTLRIVPHGAMADLNNAHPYIKRMALGYSHTAFGGEPTNAVLFAGAPYLPSSNEWFLRNRGVLLPLNVQPTRLLENLAAELLAPQSSQSTLYASGLNQAMLADPTLRRWWRYDPVADTASSNAAWRTLMDPTNASAGTYDVAHNLTTDTHDDLLMRGWVHPVSGLEMRAWVRSKDPAGGAAYTMADRFAIDNYPMKLDGRDDPRLGRMKVSLPSLDAMLNTASAGLPRVMHTLRDVFTLMLASRWDFDANGMPDFSQPPAEQAAIDRAKAVYAAMLAANMVDYVDGVPMTMAQEHTAVPIVNSNGQPVVGASGQQLLAFGFERQPFITEIYTKVTPSSVDPLLVAEGASVFAIELYNPYDSDLSLNGFRLVDLAIEDQNSAMSDTTDDLRDETSLSPLPRFDADLSGITILGGTRPLDDPARFVVICGHGTSCPDNGSNTGNSVGDFAIDNKSVIALKRSVTAPSGTSIEIIVDQMYVADLDTAVVRRGASAPVPGTFSPDPDIGVNPGVTGTVYEVSLQRDTAVPFWRFTVPKATKLFDPAEQTIGAVNHANAVDNTIYPVHLDVANTSSFTFAFPTTGSMLLLSRMAHIYDATPYDTTGGTNVSMVSPFNRVSPQLLGYFQDATGADRERNIVGQFDQIDNGRLPVFDVRPDVDDARERTLMAAAVPGLVESWEALPWGQLIFDYFTAVPFEIGAPGFGNPVYLMTQAPYNRQFATVDQSGLRVFGRINLNAAPWKVISSLPMIDGALFPRPYKDQLERVLKSGRATLGDNLAKAIVAYREGRNPWNMSANPGNFEFDRNPYGAPSANVSDPSLPYPYRPRRGFGFLSVGELVDVRHPNAGIYDATRPELANRFDADATMAPRDMLLASLPYPAASFEHAIANIVALDDNWVTTKSHVFTVYGVIRGSHHPLPDSSDAQYAAKLRSFRDADQNAIRFQSTLDRLPMLFGARQPERIGSRIMGGLVDERTE